jgi:tetratricopeptide (TPR) repeat protein
VKRKRAAHEERRNEPADYSWLLIFAAVFVAYLPALNGTILSDDLSHITLPHLRSVGGLWRIWTELGATQQYYPLLHSAFWIQHRLWGDAMTGYHFANVVFHTTAAWLVVLILRQLAIPGALLAGFIFALHPVSVESVAWISEQKNTLSAVFYLASALVYVRLVHDRGSTEQDPPYVRRAGDDGRRPSDDVRRPGLVLQTRHYWLAFALFICALLTKSVTATLPAALLVVLWWKHGRIDWRRDVLPLVPWFAVAAAAGLLTAWFEHHIIGARGEAFALTPVERLLLAGRVIWFYLAKLFWPVNLMFTYPRWTIDASQWWQSLYPIGAIALAIVLAAFVRFPAFAPDSQTASAGKRGPLAGYLFFCGTLVPALGFVNVYPFVFSYVADHFQYLACLGIIVPVAATLTVASQRIETSQGRVVKMASVALVAVLAALTWHRSGVYENAETLFRDTIARNPGAWMAYQNLGTELAAQNRLPEAIEAYEGALRARPGYSSARNNLVLAHMRVGDALADKPDGAGEAIGHYEAVVRLDPRQFRAHYNLGTILMDMPGRHAEAIEHLETALRIQPKSAEAHVNLGVALADNPLRRHDAIAHLELALAEKPSLPIRPLLEQLQSGSTAKLP